MPRVQANTKADAESSNNGEDTMSPALKKFNDVYEQLIDELITTFPNETKTLKGYELKGNNQYIDDFWSNHSKHWEALSKSNVKHFRNSNIKIV